MSQGLPRRLERVRFARFSEAELRADWWLRVRVGILTSIEIRHRYFVRALCARLKVVAVAYEDVGYSPAEFDGAGLTPAEVRIVRDHFAERTRQEAVFFGADCDFIPDSPGCPVLRLPFGTLNTDETVAFLKTAAVDIVVVYGTNLIKPPLLGAWPGRMVNMHLGLSPYYRGTGTNFYPLLNEEPEYVGATVHLLDAGIDSGPIFAHARPEIVARDTPHTIGCKAILAGIDKMLEVLDDFASGGRVAVPQWDVSNPRLYLRRDYSPTQVVELHRKVADGLIPRYVARAPRVAGRLRLIE